MTARPDRLQPQAIPNSRTPQCDATAIETLRTHPPAAAIVSNMTSTRVAVGAMFVTEQSPLPHSDCITPISV
jgi:hypothetical protein